jgi:hypothetical protein
MFGRQLQAGALVAACGGLARFLFARSAGLLSAPAHLFRKSA